MLWAITGRPFGAGEVVWGEEVGAEGIEVEEERGVLRVERAEVGEGKESGRRHKGTGILARVSSGANPFRSGGRESRKGRKGRKGQRDGG